MIDKLHQSYVELEESEHDFVVYIKR